MTEEHKEFISKQSAAAAALCEECKLNPSKYKCPGCSVRSCSLPCVTAHKHHTACSGRRQHTQFVPLSQFDDNLLLSDYNMLEDVKRIADSAQRMRVKMFGYSSFRLPFPLKSLRSAASSRRTKLLFLSNGMSKRQANQSYYNNRKKFISWTIEWRFHSTDVVLLDHGVHESTKLCSVIEIHLKPGPWNHRLKQFCEQPLQSLKFFVRKYPKGPKSPFLELDIKAPIREQLANLVIMEYPVIHVFLPSHQYDFEVIKAAIQHKAELKEPPPSHSEPSPTGVSFREEEIEDSFLDPKALDLMKHARPDRVSQSPHQLIKEKNLKDMSGSPVLARVGEDPVSNNDDVSLMIENDNLPFSINSNEIGVFDGLDFEFDQELIDVYSSLISDTNPDDFFDFERLFTEDIGQDKRKDQADICGVSIVEELEEGEIPR